MNGAAGGAGVRFEIRSARGTKAVAGAVGRAAVAAAARQRRHIAARFAREVCFDDLPCVFGDLVLPVSAECR